MNKPNEAERISNGLSHQELGTQLDLYSFHEIAPGAPFWHPKGMVIFKELEKLIREALDKQDYQEISTPIMVRKDLFEKSGHFQFYKDMMFTIKMENQTFVVKPMNCPESTIVYSSRVRSWRDLPLRFSEIGRLHRKELSGVLNGLFRVRQITMDDAHIYASPDQMLDEINKIIQLIDSFYKIFNFKTSYHLATRPDKAMGDKALWDKAEKALAEALKQNEIKYELQPKEGAFYGPKIEVHVKDSLGRSWQLGTIQVDFNMAESFKLGFMNDRGKKEPPVVIHRAVFGSFERFIGILVENYQGAFPVWISPVQVKILSLTDRNADYAKKIATELKESGVRAEVDDSNETIGKKIRAAELEKLPYILVIGDKEEQVGAVAVRARGKGNLGPMEFEKFKEKILNEIVKKI
ncbi:threonine--tRNA ligase [Candidatus Azambacteria bacterium RIFCSPHIGHO2_01_FULL_44_55]|uniref:Threonine--tRNA ligase n=1 Tax=Candidatus Azambacteria bacterium RIFCSPLOWO2_02_FULL_44_14 TaxID=1797306 RepID=A0A1F5CCZ8_9BACT|nr:MAG: threonine--tRNA ligase [Candidatus Azambacteria bacterium RIFCSPLOWO2_01_FULL_44_84]OGD33281.1 MAG: threonine--tRNA ligase [Candidatus Azambacteria bacterium RIFCSPHIGHO2_02_FULL_45_18]OGD40727.1 MAG: threonine--tRNA ligase [Candidatus Azambacteria bacterium RIFCSPLOWO2_02_FULL_44_14]OGD40827.1 MAG: threonine--tRNA ligase [Candidatus Azambacteria bacterium RIFCSPHIGHO2_01_FULL_44_55]OGD51540.1 MAG: threonine--tRNA ligase [Candidatus Azambacteria bacterium RIFOXYD1_FULL_44_10]